MENYVLYNLTKKCRSLCIESSGARGYVNLEEEKLICSAANLNDVENEYHFTVLFYFKPRHILFSKVKGEIDFLNIDDAQRLSWLFTYDTFKLANYLKKATRVETQAPYQDTKLTVF